MDLTKPCPLCSSNTYQIFDTLDFNRRVSGEEFRYRRCSHCGLIFLHNPPSDLAKYYADEYYAIPAPPELEQTARAEAYQIELVLRYVRPGRLIEIGPAWGVFALQARQAGFEVETIEMNAACCDYLHRALKVRAINSNRPDEILPSLEPSRVIAMWRVLEHLIDPWACLDASVNNLEMGGLLVIATPNPESLGFRIMGRRWPHVDAPRHLWLFPIDLLKDRLDAFGMTLESVTTSDLGARRWNRFAWQRFSMSVASSQSGRMAAYLAGTALAEASRPIERRGRNGSSYTAVFRKVG